LNLRGLRPPGVRLAFGSADVLSTAGVSYISPVGVPSGVLDSGSAVLEFRLAATDMAFYAPAFAQYRMHDPGPHVVGPEAFVEGMMAQIEDVVVAGGFLSTVCHPFMQSPTEDRTDPARIEAIGEVTRRIASDERIWNAPCGEVADWMRAHPTDYPAPASLEAAFDWGSVILPTCEAKLSKNGMVARSRSFLC
jgi:hypothetical protein